MSLADDILSLIEQRPGLTEREMAEALFGAGAYQQRVNSTSQRLVKGGLIERHGAGGPGDPFRYHRPTQKRSRMGFLAGQFTVPADFDTMMQDEIIAMFEGED